jgi:hypothetical protein
MKRIFPILFLLAIAIATYFIINKTILATKKPTVAEKEVLEKNTAYYKAHHKNVGEFFVVDNIGYSVQSFNYIPKKDTLVLLVDITIKNNTNAVKNFESNFFSVLKDNSTTHYATNKVFSIAANTEYKTQLVYNLPERVLPYIIADVQINSTTDSTQNAFVRCFKNYRAQG